MYHFTGIYRYQDRGGKLPRTLAHYVYPYIVKGFAAGELSLKIARLSAWLGELMAL